jgi:hypothetical protein
LLRFSVEPVLTQFPFTSNHLQLFSQKTPAKSLVKPQTDPKQAKSTTSTWHFSSTQPAILKTLRENGPGQRGRFFLIAVNPWNILDVNHFL